VRKEKGLGWVGSGKLNRGRERHIPGVGVAEVAHDGSGRRRGRCAAAAAAHVAPLHGGDAAKHQQRLLARLALRVAHLVQQERQQRGDVVRRLGRQKHLRRVYVQVGQGCSTNADKEKQRKKRQRQRKIEVATEMLHVAMAAMDSSGVRCVRCSAPST